MGALMAHIVCEPCRDCKYTVCVQVCPVDCFYHDEVQLYIHPTECIDCKRCVPVCPVGAILQDVDVPDDWQSYISLNEERPQELHDTGNIIKKQEPKLGRPECEEA